VIGKGGYVYLPQGVPSDSIRFAEGTEILHYREYGEAGFDAVDSVDAPRWADAREDVIVIDTEAMAFDAVPNAGPMPGRERRVTKVPVAGRSGISGPLAGLGCARRPLVALSKED